MRSSDWWTELLTRLTRAGIAGFRCLTLDLVPASFWRRLTATLPESLFLAWTPGVTGLQAFAGIGFDLTCSSAGWWDGRASWFLDEQVALQEIAPAMASPEPSFLERLTHRLPPDADVAASYRLALRIAASTGAGSVSADGLRIRHRPAFRSWPSEPADMEAAERERPADLSEDIAAAIRQAAELPPLAQIEIDHQPGGAGDSSAAV